MLAPRAKENDTSRDVKGTRMFQGLIFITDTTSNIKTKKKMAFVTLSRTLLMTLALSSEALK